jgi:hypothetical protein
LRLKNKSLKSKISALYFPLDDQVIFVSFFFRPAALQMLDVALAMPALCALQVKKINSPKFHLSIPREVLFLSIYSG